MDMTDLASFFLNETKTKGWDIFNWLFIRKAIDMALDKNNNEREGCSKLLQACTQELNFDNMDFGYAFDFMIWN